MFLLPHNHHKAKGDLGSVYRGTGYLQGGYKGSTVRTEIQLYNTTTETGQIVFDTGFARSYVPGVPGDNHGYYAASGNTFRKFSYGFRVDADIFTLSNSPQVSLYDFQSNSTCYFGLASSYWTKFSTASETPVSTVLTTQAISTSRHGLSLKTCGSFLEYNNTGNMYTYVYSNDTYHLAVTNSLLGSGSLQIGCGMSKSQTEAHAFGMFKNALVQYSGTTVVAVTEKTAFTYQFGESHAVSTPLDAYVMAGYADTSGRYGGSQHALCQCYRFSTDAVRTLPDLVVPQSSGQMMQGY